MTLKHYETDSKTKGKLSAIHGKNYLIYMLKKIQPIPNRLVYAKVHNNKVCVIGVYVCLESKFSAWSKSQKYQQLLSFSESAQCFIFIRSPSSVT